MERRLAAILAADVAGYSRLMGADEEGTLNALRARREVMDGLIVAHRGRVFGSAGDSVVAEFGSAVEAVHAAVEIQREMARRNEPVPPDKRLEFRIGLNIGDVMVEGGNLFGDGVNVSARVEALAEPGGICVSSNVYSQVKTKVGVAFEPLGEHRVKNIAEPVSVYRVLIDGAARRPRMAAILARLHGRRTVTAALVASLLVVAAGATAWYVYPRQQPLSGPPTVAVLPLANVTGDPALDYFADGTTENLIASLARSPQVRVIARTSSDIYKGKSIDIRQIGKELGTRYILEGSVQKSGNKMRIVAQLIDTSDGSHAWAERYDREGADPLALQDEIAERVIGTLAGEVGLIRKMEYERVWGKDRANLVEYDYYLRGHELFDRMTKEDTLQAIAVWQEGLDRYPDSLLLRIKVGWGHYQLVYGGWSTDPTADLRRAFELVNEGLAGKNLGPIGKFSGHVLLAWLQIYLNRDWEQAWHERDIVLALNPYDPTVIAMMAELAIQAGRPDEAIASLERNVSWDTSQLVTSPHFRFGLAHFVKGEYRTALEHLKREPNLEPMYTLTFLAATYAELGQIDEARATVAKILEANPEITLSVIQIAWPFRHVADAERLATALRKAGLPE